MNVDEFLASINKQAGLHHLTRLADRDFLHRHEVILGSGPYNPYHIREAVHLLRTECEFLGKLDGRPERKSETRVEAPEVAISQIVAINNSDAKQCHRIRNGLIRTGLINFEGPVFVNFSPFTGMTIDSLPSDAFKGTDYYMEYSFVDIVNDKQKTEEELGRALHPVVFIKDVEPTLVLLTYILGGNRQPGLGPGAPLPSPLYHAFLNVSADSAQEIMDFMNTYKVYLFTMRWDPQQLLNYTRGIEKTMNLDLVVEEAELTRFWAAEQQQMRNVLEAAARGRLPQVVFPPVFPQCEEAIVEWHLISGYFDPRLVETSLPDGVRLALLEFEKSETPNTTVRIRRYYGWRSYIWAELAHEIWRGKAASVCAWCGRVISQGKHGRPKRFCSREENPQCYKERKATYVAASRKK